MVLWKCLHHMSWRPSIFDGLQPWVMSYDGLSNLQSVQNVKFILCKKCSKQTAFHRIVILAVRTF